MIFYMLQSKKFNFMFSLSACPHRQFHTLPGLLDSWAALPNSNPNACVSMQECSLYHFYEGLWYDPAGRRTPDLLCEANSRPTVREADTLTTEPTRHGTLSQYTETGHPTHPITVYRHRTQHPTLSQ